MWVRATHSHCHVEFQGPVFLGPGFSLHIPDHGTLIVGPGVEFRRGFHCEIAANGKVVIGAGSAFTYDCLIQCSTLIEIGERCMFAQSTVIVDGNHRFRDTTRPALEQGYDFRDIHIGNDVGAGQTDGVVTGNRTRVKIVKNKVAPPFTEAEFDIMYNEGISSTGALLDLALEKQIVEKRGSWMSYKGAQLAQGRDAAKEVLKNDPALYEEIELAVKAKLDEEKK